MLLLLWWVFIRHLLLLYSCLFYKVSTSLSLCTCDLDGFTAVTWICALLAAFPQDLAPGRPPKKMAARQGEKFTGVPEEMGVCVVPSYLFSLEAGRDERASLPPSLLLPFSCLPGIFRLRVGKIFLPPRTEIKFLSLFPFWPDPVVYYGLFAGV